MSTIDLFGLTLEEVQTRFPEVYQHLLIHVKPERDQNNREGRRKNWWLFGETNPKLRKQLAGLPRYIATVETSKHRFFQFLDQEVLPDNIANAVFVLCTDQLSHTTGLHIPVDAGVAAAFLR